MIRRLVLSAVALMSCLPLIAAEKVDTSEPAAGSAVIAKDPATGVFRAPTVVEMQELLEQKSIMFKSAPASVEVITLSDGTLSAVLDDSFQNFTLVTRATDGDLTHLCLSGVHASEHLLEVVQVRTSAPVAEEK